MKFGRKHSKGVALVSVLLISIVFLLLSSSMLYLLSVEYKTILYNDKQTKLLQQSEIGIQVAFNKIKRLFQNTNVVPLRAEIKLTPTQEEFDTGIETIRDDINTLVSDKLSINEKYFIEGNYYEYQFKDAVTSRVIPVYYRVSENEWVDDGILSGNSTKSYKVESITQNKDKQLSCIVSDIVINRKNLFNYSVFFNDTLEIVTNKAFSLDGPIHSNGDIFIDSLSDMLIDSEITSSGNIIRGRKNYENSLNGNVKIKSDDNSYYSFTQDNDSLSYYSPNTSEKNVDKNWPQYSIKTWKGLIQDSSHKVKMKNTITRGQIENNNYYYENSGLKIVTGIVSGKTKIEAFDKNGNKIYSEFATNLNENDVLSEQEFTDKSEEKNVKVTVIDLNKLMESSFWPENNVVYATRTDSIEDSNPEDEISDPKRVPNGILIKNSSKLTKPVIFVTNNPLYIKGDFNLHQTSQGEKITKEMESFGKPDIDMWKPITLISDSITLLSNSWNKLVSVNVASDTNYNFAVLTGNNKNYKTFDSNFLTKTFKVLENWENKNITINGSISQLWDSKYSTGQGNFLGVTNFPDFKFNFDNSFVNNTLPEAFYKYFPSITESIEIKNWKKILDNESKLLKDLKKTGKI